jgi:hypothetical protein
LDHPITVHSRPAEGSVFTIEVPLVGQKGQCANDHAEGQRTVVIEIRGEAAGRRIVRGREAECRQICGL